MPLTGVLPQPTAVQAQSGALLQMITGHWVAQTVRAGAHLRVADHVAAGAGTAEQVAQLESSDGPATYRLMRALAALGLLSHKGEGRFSVTALGELLQEDAPGSLRAAALARSGPGVWEHLMLLPEAVREGQSPAVRAAGGDIFGYFAANEEAAHVFSQAMSDLTRQVAEDTVAVLDLGDARSIADIGGANGALVLALPGARAAAAEAGLQDRFSALSGDFFDSVPRADYYLLKWILHDWSDEDCVRILRNCRAAGGHRARALIVEALIGEVGRPDPVALFDMNMLAVTGGRQRTLKELDAIFAASGWRRAGLSPTRTIDSLMELEAA
jgi:O-methyltransferase domain/Dimerisation domain